MDVIEVNMATGVSTTRPATETEIASLPVPAEPDPKLVGIEFQGVMCSATKDDQNGLMAVLMSIQLQGTAFKPVQFEFENGSTLIITRANYQAFTAKWLPFRQSFFTVQP
jgi:hypothetical protein